MSIVARFHPTGMTAEQYDRVSDQVRQSGNWPPDGLRLHVCFGTDGDLSVSEIWDSREQMQAFGETLMPVLQQGGVQMSADPEIFEIHNMETH
jgi:hypothetical protein